MYKFLLVDFPWPLENFQFSSSWTPSDPRYQRALHPNQGPTLRWPLACRFARISVTGNHWKPMTCPVIMIYILLHGYIHEIHVRIYYDLFASSTLHNQVAPCVDLESSIVAANTMFSTKFEIKRSVLLTAFPFGRANSDTHPDIWTGVPVKIAPTSELLLPKWAIQSWGFNPDSSCQ